MRKSLIAAAAALTFAATPAMADEIGDALAAAADAYAAGNVTIAKQQADLASALLSQAAAEALAAALPEPLEGWTASEASSEAGGAMFGGGISASRYYTSDTGESVSIEIMADSPMLMQLGMMFANPAMAVAMGKIVTINGQQAIEGNDGGLQMMVANRFLVSVTGSADMGAKRAYAAALDLSAVGG